jgi:phosphate uptake regulator
MEYRKLISFGKSSYVVSLPKPWVRQNKLEKGDLIYVEDKGSALLLSAVDTLKIDEEKQETIEVDGKEIKQIKREIIGAYIKNNKTITLLGNEIKDKAKELQPIIQSLVALEVMEQTSSKIVAKDFLNMADVSTNTIIRKMDVIIRSMIDDCEKMFDEENYESIYHRDNDVNKLTFLIFRIVKFGLTNASYMVKKFNLNSINLLNLWWLASDLETIADEVKRIARYMNKIKLDKNKQDVYKGILKELKKSYLSLMKAYYDQNIDSVHKIINGREELISKCEKFYLENRSVEGIAFLIDRTKVALVHINHIGRILYQ